MNSLENDPLSNIIFVTFPRSGLNYFAEYFEQVTKMYLPRSHFQKDIQEQTTFSIVRNPLDTIVSGVSMHIHTNREKSLEKVARDTAKEYFDFYNNFINKSTHNVLSYDDFIKNPKTILKNFTKYLNIEYFDLEYVDVLKSHDDYIISSRTSDMYNVVLEYVKTLDLSAQYEEYNKAIQKKMFV